MAHPTITFFCELDTDSLAALFSGNKVLSALTKLEANVSLGLLDLSAGRAEVIKSLNRAHIPVTAWLLLPKEQGYWTSLDTIEETAIQYHAFKAWKTKYKLNFSAIGLDIEPKLNTVSEMGKNPWNQRLQMVKRYFSSREYSENLAAARALVHMIQADGFAVETYQFPTVIDERAARSNVLAKTLGISDLPSDREVLMLYSSFFPSYADSILWSYTRECNAVGVGSTGGGVEIEGLPAQKTLRWIDLKRDLLLASQVVDHIYIFSLEGCVSNNYMDRLLDLDWCTQITPPERTATGISLIRKMGQGLLWVLSHPVEIGLGIVFLSSLMKLVRKLFASSKNA